MMSSPAAIRAGTSALVILLVWCAPADAGEPFGELSRELRRLVDKQHVPSVVVAVARDGQIIWEDAAGWADRERRILASPQIPYSLASISKPFTATAVMKLVEAGDLALDGPANDYLEGARITGARPERATLRRVLSHTAGLPAYYRVRSSTEPSFDDTIARRAILTRSPGRRYLYSNLGYGILDHIITRASGVPYEEFLRREVFGPLRLERAGAAADAPPGAAVRYGRTGAPLPFYELDHRGASAVYASAQDLARFGMYHLNERTQDRAGVLDRRTIREMQRIHAWVAPGKGYGLGWRIDEDDLGFRHVGHTGGMPGVTTVLSLFPSERVVIVVLANGQSDQILPLARRVAAAAMPQYGWRLRQSAR
jgi:CubicO group peptidase (beta-lactamase class C family)